MLVITNEAVVQKRIGRNRILFWFGVGCLLASMVSLVLGAGVPTLVFIFGYPFLILGVILSKRGAFNNRRHGVGGFQVKSEEVQIEDQLKGVPPRFHLYNWVTIGGQLYEHLLVTPNGLLILYVKPQIGKLKASNDRFRLRQGPTGWLGSLGEPMVGNPTKDLDLQVKNLRGWFESKEFDLPTDGIIIFNNPRTEIIDAEEMSYPVCHMKDLRLAVRGWDTELNMTVQEQQIVEKLIIENLPAEQSEKVQQLAQMPEYKRKALLDAEKPTKKEAVISPKERAKAVKAAAPIVQGGTNQKTGLNGKPLAPKVEKVKKSRRDGAVLPKINPGAFGEASNRKK